MSTQEHERSPVRKTKREFTFLPRTINPVKMAHAVIFSGGEELRSAEKALREHMPWVKTHILSNPASLSALQFDEGSVFILDDAAMIISDTERLRRNNENIVLVLLSSNPYVYCSPPSVAEVKFPYTSKADLVFAMDKREFTPKEVVASAFRSAEDLLNITRYSKARRFIFLIVDDEPRWFSQFLPVLYDIIGQRADVMITRTYEETLRFLFGTERECDINEESYRSSGFGDDVVCLIADIFFPRGDDLSSKAGVDLIRLTRRYYPRYPVIIASKAKEAEELADLGFILPKGDPGSLEKLREYIQDFSGLRDFVLRDDDGEELYRAKNIHDILRLLLEAEKESPRANRLRASMQVYADSDFFSTWLYMHSYRELADFLRPKQVKGAQLLHLLRRCLRREILRMNCTPLVFDGNKIYNLRDLLHVARTVDAEKMQPLSDRDIFSSWLDRKGYPELAEELRPVHESGEEMRSTLIHCVEKWLTVYEEREIGQHGRSEGKD